MNRLLLLPLAIGSLLVSGCKSQDAARDASKAQPTATSAMTTGTGGSGGSSSAAVDAHPDLQPVKVTVDVKFTPATIPAKKGEPLAIEFTRTTDKTCAKEVIFDGGPLKGTQVDLPLEKPVRVSFTPDADGEIVFGCHMGRMISGKVNVAS